MRMYYGGGHEQDSTTIDHLMIKPTNGVDVDPRDVYHPENPDPDGMMNVTIRGEIRFRCGHAEAAAIVEQLLMRNELQIVESD